MTVPDSIGVLGAGTMGAGIAQIAAENGFDVLLHDPVPGASERARERIAGFLRRKVEKGQLGETDADAALSRVSEAGAAEALAGAGVVIEAIPEELELKREAFHTLDAAAGPDTILATNTSSLSVTAIAAGADRPERVVGMHFFNPVPLMQLVEVIPGTATPAEVVERTMELARRLGKTPVVAADSPGFIVNRVQRALYLESFRIFESGAAGIGTIDAAMRAAGFRMGPFELADVVGTDVNLAAGTAIWEGFERHPRYTPAAVQHRVVETGRLGRKTSAGYYEYEADGSRGEPWPAVDEAVADALEADAIQARVLATIVNEAASAVGDRVAEPAAIDTAMRLAANWPDGPLVWGERIGLPSVVATLDGLEAEVGDGRYAVVPLLRRLADERGSFFVAAEGG